MKVLVSGAEGFVASNLIRRLNSENVIALDYIATHKPLNISPNIDFVNFDLSKGVPPMDDIDLIIHLATINQLAISATPRLVNINIAAIHNVLDLAVTKHARLIFSSSCSVYGNGLNLKEDRPLNPQSLYAIGKSYEEQMIRFYHDHYGVAAIILRFSNCYGDTTQIWNKIYAGKRDVSRIFMESIMGSVPVPLIGGMGRDYTYIDDVVESILAFLNPKGFDIYNVGTGVETLTNELPPIIGKALDMPVSYVTIPPRDTDNIIHRSLNIEKISPYWKPKTDLKKGMKKYAKDMFG